MSRTNLPQLASTTTTDPVLQAMAYRYPSGDRGLTAISFVKSACTTTNRNFAIIVDLEPVGLIHMTKSEKAVNELRRAHGNIDYQRAIRARSRRC